MNTKPPEDKPASTSPPPPYPGYPPPYWYHPPEQETSLLEIWDAIVRRKFTVILITLVTTGVALVAAVLMTPIYRAETLLAPVSDEQSAGLQTLAGQFGDRAALASINVGRGNDKTAEYVAALKSRVLSIAFIKEQNLMPVLFADKWDKANKRWKTDGTKTPTEWKAFEMWDKGIRQVTQDKRTGLVTLAIEWEDPSLAAKWANDLVKHVNARLRAEAIGDVDRSIAYLKKQLPGTSSVEVQQAIYRLIEAETKKKMIASTREEYAFTTIDPAVTPERKARPNRSVLVLTGLLLGLFFGVAAAIVVSRRHTGDVAPARPQ
ncbi:MAG: Wzz/FepE/Etk N-terminal domain-containing protein [Gammaproteobacteria bacterium]|nr:Wzz/FepE/Etk N-terminal domain-containing protein [Gammaproteobacteria bacterium]